MSFKVPPPTSKQPIIIVGKQDVQGGNGNGKGEGTYPWLSWFRQLFTFLQTALGVEDTSSSATGASGGEQPYATHDGNDSPVPYEPEGFIIVEIEGAQKKIPYFNL